MSSPEWRTYPEYKLWRAEVYARDEWKCVQCDSKEKLEAHHIKPCRTHPELTHDVYNGVTLCKSCHRKIAGKEHMLEAYFQEIVKNAVNSGKLPLGNAKDNPEPSRDRNDSEGVTTRRRGFDIEQFNNPTVSCAVCGESKTIHYYRYKENGVYFCSNTCRGKFMRSDDRFVKPRSDKFLDKKCKYCQGVITPNSTGSNKYKTYCKQSCATRYQIEVLGHNINARANKYKLEGKWSRKYDKCIECGKTEHAYASRGKCKKCYMDTYNKLNWRKYTASNSPKSAAPERDDIVCSA